MSMQFDQINAEMNNVDPYLIEKVWRDLDGQLSREYVRRVVAEVARGFQDAKVKAFLPILIHREALKQLKDLSR